MPFVYACEHCHLMFQVGSYQQTNAVFSARELFVCHDCGAMHAIDTAYTMNDGYQVTGKKYRLLSQPAPIIMDEMVREETELLQLLSSLKEWVQRGNLEFDRYPSLILGDVICNFCGKAGKISSQWDENNHHCSACKNRTVKLVRAWMT